MCVTGNIKSPKKNIVLMDFHNTPGSLSIAMRLRPPPTERLSIINYH